MHLFKQSFISLFNSRFYKVTVVFFACVCLASAHFTFVLNNVHFTKIPLCNILSFLRSVKSCSDQVVIGCKIINFDYLKWLGYQQLMIKLIKLLIYNNNFQKKNALSVNTLKEPEGVTSQGTIKF